MKKTVFATIGVGGIAQSQHIPNLLRAPHARLKTLCDLDADKLKMVADKYSIAHTTRDLAQVLADPEIDAVVVATRVSHAPLTVQALKAGKHVYVEKPLADTTEECRSVVTAQRESGKHVAMGFNRRFAPAYTQAKEILTRHGGPKNIYYRISDELWARMKSAANPRGYDPGTRYVHEVCHIFDVLRWLTGSEVASIYCVAARPDEDIAVLEFESGCIATILSSGYATMDMPKERLEVIAGDKGGVIVEEFVELRTFGFSECRDVYRYAGHTHPDYEILYRYLFEKEGANIALAARRAGWELRERNKQLKDDDAIFDAREVKGWSTIAPWNYMFDKGWLRAMDHFAEEIGAGRTPETASAQDGLKAAILAQAAVRSRDTHRVVRLSGGKIVE